MNHAMTPETSAVEPGGMDFQRHIGEITTQTDLLRATIAGADMTVPVPSCPGWNVGQLVRHLGGAHRWVAETVRTPASTAPPQEEVRELDGYTHEDPAVLGPWLAEGAALLTDALREAEPDVRLWVPVPSLPPYPTFHARRMAHETVVHRADATLALGAGFTVGQRVAVDTLEEWMELGSLPEVLEFHPQQRELLGPGRTVALHATDTPPGLGAEWVVDLTGEAITWRRGHEAAAVAVRGPLTELLLLVYRRRPMAEADIEVLGDADLLDFWLDRVSFG